MARWFSISGETDKGRVSEILSLAADGPQIPDFNFPIPSKMDELAMLYFFIISMKAFLPRIALSFHSRMCWNKWNKDNTIWRNDEISLICIFTHCHSVIQTSNNMPALPVTVAIIMLLVKVQRDLSSAFVNRNSVGMDKIAQVMEFLRATINVSPSQKRVKKRPGVFVFTVINQPKGFSSFW